MKPVAWIDPKELDMDASTSVTKSKHFDNDIPLYTHPVKELTMTDDEVMDLWNEQSSHPIDFARAILRKAQNK